MSFSIDMDSLWGSVLGALLLAIIAGRMLRYLLDQRASPKWPAVAGKIEEIRVQGNDAQGYLVEYRYSYEVDGEKYLGMHSEPTPIPYSSWVAADSHAKSLKRQESVSVHFDPTAPEASTVTPGETGSAWFGIALAGWMFLSALYLLYKWWA